MRHASRYSIGGRPTARVKRSKNAERDSAAFFASWATVHGRAGSPCICRIAAASRASANPRSKPGGASSPCVDRSASMSSTSTRRASTRSRPDLLLARFLADEPHQYRKPLDAAHVHQRRQQRHQQRRIGRVENEVAAEQTHVGIDRRGVPWRTSPVGAGVAFGSMNTGVAGSKPDMVKPGVAGRSTKSPASSVTASWPSTARRQRPSSTVQKLGWPKSE